MISHPSTNQNWFYLASEPRDLPDASACDCQPKPIHCSLPLQVVCALSSVQLEEVPTFYQVEGFSIKFGVSRQDEFGLFFFFLDKYVQQYK